jgi:hypothetical protein
VVSPVPETAPTPVASVFVQTRGRPRHRDYDFLGGGPAEPWWRAYAGHTAFERPTVLVESDGAGYRVYLSGIPSGRRDAVGTVIRYTVVLRAGADGSPGVAADGALALVSCWVEDQAVGGVGAVSRALDAEFPEDEVERMLAAADPVAPAEVRDRVLAAVGALPPAAHEPTGVPGDPDAPVDWWGDAGALLARTAFTERVAELLVAGRPGRALLLNLVGTPDDLAPLADGRSLAVLAPDVGGAVGGAAIAPLEQGRVDVGKARPSATAPPTRTATPPTAAVAVMRAVSAVSRLPRIVVAVVVLVIALVIPLLVLAPLLVLPLLGH